MMANFHTVVLTPDPKWFLKLIPAALLLAVPLTAGAWVVKARRNTIALTFTIALAALLAGHFAISFSEGGYGVLFTLAIVLVTIGLGIRYLLITSFLPSLSIALIAICVLLGGLLVFSQVKGVF